MEQTGRLSDESAVSNVVPSRCSKSVYKTKRLERGVLIVSALQIVIGVVCVAFQSVTLHYGLRQNKLRRGPPRSQWSSDSESRFARYPELSWTDDILIAPGIWIGCSYIAAGVVGVISAIRNNKGLVIGMMVSNIFTAGFCWIMIGMMGALIGCLTNWDCYGYDENTGRYILKTSYYHYDRTTTISYFDCNKTPRNISIVLEIIMLTLSVVNFGVAIFLSVAGCCYSCPCCKETTNRQQVPPYQMVVYQNGAYWTCQPGVSQCAILHSQPVGHQASVPAPNYNQLGQPAPLNYNQYGQPGSLQADNGKSVPVIPPAV